MKLELAGGDVAGGPSPLARGRGLKRKMSYDSWGGQQVAPRAGAWIETRR